MDFRCVKINMPQKDKINLFKEFADMCSFYLFNKIMIEIKKEDLLRTADITEICDYCDDIGIEVIPLCDYEICNQVYLRKDEITRPFDVATYLEAL